MKYKLIYLLFKLCLLIWSGVCLCLFPLFLIVYGMMRSSDKLQEIEYEIIERMKQ